ncbi:MAG: hypothetical protein IPK46_00115 [Saprospiraceae bacterium]|nr:hypothetical protein [Saprospiraceae bacterium]
MYWFVKPRISYGNYFALSGGVGNNDDYLFIIFSNASDVKSGNVITMPADGELFCLQMMQSIFISTTMEE